MVPTPIYERSEPGSSSDLSGFCTPSERSSYTLVDRIEMMTGSADMYIAAVYNTNRAGATSLMLIMVRPTDRTLMAWNSPEMVRFPGGMLVIEGKSIWRMIQKIQSKRWSAIWMAVRYHVLIDGNRRMKHRRG